MTKEQQHLTSKLSSKKYYSTLFLPSPVWNLIPGIWRPFGADRWGLTPRNNLFDRLGRWPRNVCMRGVVGGVRAIAEESGETHERLTVSSSNVHEQKISFRRMLCEILVIHTHWNLISFFRHTSYNIQATTRSLFVFCQCFPLSVTFRCSEFAPLPFPFRVHYW